MSVDNGLLIHQLRAREAVFVAFHGMTHMPYVICDPETFNDEVWAFATEALLKEFKEKIAERQIPIAGFRLEMKAAKGFYLTLYSMGVNEFVFVDENATTKIALSDLEKQPDISAIPLPRRPLLNPTLKLSAIYYVQEILRKVPNEEKKTLPQLSDELYANVARSRFLLAYQMPNDRVPLTEHLKKKDLKLYVTPLKDGRVTVPIFSDVYELNKFQRGKQKVMALPVSFSSLVNFIKGDVNALFMNPNGCGIILSRQLLDTISRNYPDEVQTGVEEMMKINEEIMKINQAQKAALERIKMSRATPPSRTGVPGLSNASKVTVFAKARKNRLQAEEGKASGSTDMEKPDPSGGKA